MGSRRDRQTKTDTLRLTDRGRKAFKKCKKKRLRQIEAEMDRKWKGKGLNRDFRCNNTVRPVKYPLMPEDCKYEKKCVGGGEVVLGE